MLTFASIVLSILCAEFVMRQFYPIDTGSSFEHRIPHPVYGWVLERGASYVNRMPEAEVRVTYNSKGWRDIEHSYANDSNTPRILILGDSYMEAYSVEFEDTFYQQLEHNFRDQGIETEVINLGVGGYGTLQEYLLYKNEGKRYKPSVVLLGFYNGNDVRNNSLQLEFILKRGRFRLSTRPFLVKTPAGPWEITTVDYEGAVRRYNAAKAQQEEASLFAYISKNSALVQSIHRVVSDQTKKPVSGTGNSRSEHSISRRAHMAFHGTRYCEEPQEVSRAWNITRRILKKLKREVEASGSELIVFTVPSWRDLDADEKNTLNKNAPDSVSLCLEEARVYQRTNAILEKLEIRYIDLFPAFREASNSGVNLFRRSDRHWNEAGHALAAKQVGQYLVKHNDLLNKRSTD